MTYNRTRRRTFTDFQRAAFFEAHQGVCYLCSQKIRPPKEKWEIEHIIARELLGPSADDDDNLALAHVDCHKEKTKADRAAIAKSNAVRAKHMGAHRPKQSFQSAGFPKAAPQRRASTPHNKHIGQFEEPAHD